MYIVSISVIFTLSISKILLSNFQILQLYQPLELSHWLHFRTCRHRNCGFLRIMWISWQVSNIFHEIFFNCKFSSRHIKCLSLPVHVDLRMRPNVPVLIAFNDRWHFSCCSFCHNPPILDTVFMKICTLAWPLSFLLSFTYWQKKSITTFLS